VRTQVTPRDAVFVWRGRPPPAALDVEFNFCGRGRAPYATPKQLCDIVTKLEGFGPQEE